MATEPRPIRSEADYEAAPEEAERLWGAGSGTPEGARLDVLATLIEVHEAKHYPMDPPKAQVLVGSEIDEKVTPRQSAA